MEDERIIVVEGPGGKVFGGSPCEVLSSIERFEVPQKETGQLSPDRRYRADMEIVHWEGERMENITTIKEIATNQVILTVNWNGSPYARADSGWLNNDLYIIGRDNDEGVIYFSAQNDRVGNLVSDLLRINPQDLENIYRIGHTTDIVTGQYHLVIEFWPQPPSSPLLLYHSELDLVEEIPFYQVWDVNGSGFSQDGRWLFLSYPTSLTHDPRDYWIRPVDPMGSTALLLENEYEFAGFSNETNKIIFTGGGYVKILDFPSGEVVSLFDLSGYDLNRVKWSPDGTRIMVQGAPFDSRPEALFVLEP
jgi:hypothetical protein